jgi:Stress responsive A/B Barrel Domain
MLRHVVSIRLREDAPEGSLDKLIDALNALPSRIQEIRGFQVGRDVVRGPRSAHVVLIADFDDLDALDRYRVHPEHRHVVDTYIKPQLEHITAVDFET